MAEAARKTPVSQLRDILIKHSTRPVYELADIKGPAHARSFQYRVTFQDVMAVGKGTSKQWPKHAAAKAALNMIGAEEDGLSVGTNSSIPEVETGILTPADDGFMDRVQGMCTSRHWPKPKYEVAKVEGMPHDRLFTIVQS